MAVDRAWRRLDWRDRPSDLRPRLEDRRVAVDRAWRRLDWRDRPSDLPDRRYTTTVHEITWTGLVAKAIPNGLQADRRYTTTVHEITWTGLVAKAIPNGLQADRRYTTAAMLEGDFYLDATARTAPRCWPTGTTTAAMLEGDFYLDATARTAPRCWPTGTTTAAMLEECRQSLDQWLRPRHIGQVRSDSFPNDYSADSRWTSGFDPGILAKLEATPFRTITVPTVAGQPGRMGRLQHPIFTEPEIGLTPGGQKSTWSDGPSAAPDFHRT